MGNKLRTEKSEAEMARRESMRDKFRLVLGRDVSELVMGYMERPNEQIDWDATVIRSKLRAFPVRTDNPEVLKVQRPIPLHVHLWFLYSGRIQRLTHDKPSVDDLPGRVEEWRKLSLRKSDQRWEMRLTDFRPLNRRRAVA